MEWFWLRENPIKKIALKKALSHSYRKAPPTPSWPLSQSLQEVREFLFRERYLIAIEERQVFGEDQPLYYVGLVANLNREGTAGLFIPTITFAHATDISYERAFSRAVGEFVERYCFLIYKETNLLQSSINQLIQSKVPLVSPLKFPVLSSANFVKSNELLWGKGQNLCSGEETLLPAQLIFWNYNPHHRLWNEPLLRERNTCGLASAYNKNLAIRNALYELIQRDTFFVYWFNELAPPKLVIDITIENKRLVELMVWCKRRSLEIDFVNITADIPVPSYLCILRDQKGDKSLLSLGIGTGHNTERALESAVFEAVGLYRWSLEESKNHEETPNFSEITQGKTWKNTFAVAERIFMWSRKDMFSCLSFLLEGETVLLSDIKKTEKNFSTLEQELDFTLTYLKELGSDYEPVAFFSDHFLAKNLSSYAVRVFIPALIPMYMEEIGSIIEEHPRIKEVPKKMGYKSRDKVYPYPHPFP